MKYIKIIDSLLLASVDDDDFNRCIKYRWHLTGIGKQIRNSEGVMLSNFVMNSTDMFDHKDVNFLNNQKINLRSCTHAQNCANKKKYLKGSSSQYKGVSYCNRDDCWRAFIKVKQKGIALGTFRTEQSAAFAYDRAARKYFGEFAQINFPRVSKS